MAFDKLQQAPGFRAALAMVALYALLRTVDAPEPLLLAWTAAALVGALAGPLFGLTLLAGLGPFTQALDDAGRVSAAPLLVAATAGSVGLRVLAARHQWRSWLTAPLALAGAVLGLSLLAVGTAWVALGSAAGLDALRLWVPGIGGAMAVLLAAAWLGRTGEARPLAVAAVSIALAAAVSLVDHLSTGWLAEGWLGWMVRPGAGFHRLTGVIPAPNPAAAIMLVGLGLTGATALLADAWRWRLAALAASALLVSAIVLTYSRSGFFALALVALLLAWRWRRRAGMLLGAGGVVALMIVATDSRLARVPLVADAERLDAWRASAEMWLAAPLTGHGLRSFELLHLRFGATLDAPHNEWLRLFAEGGIALGLAGVALVVTTTVILLRAPDWRVFAGGLAGVALFVMATFNNPFLYSQVNVPSFLVVGTALGLASARAARPAPEPSATG